MPVVEIDPDELRELTARSEKSDAELREDLFALGLEFEGETDDGAFQLEFAPDRLDRLSVEGVARSLRYQYGDDRGVYVPTTNDAEWVVEVEDVPESRPHVTAAVVRGVDMTAGKLESLIQLQEKLHATMGRKRAKGAIGVHDLAMLKGTSAQDGTEKTITYTGIAPDGDRFVPLDADTDMTPATVLSDHPIGDAYADLVADYDSYPAIYDDIGLFSFPPVINGKRTEVDEGSRDLLVEMTGTDQWTIDRMLTIVCYALDARGGRIEEVEVRYPDRELVRPDLATRTKSVAHERIESTLGVDLSTEDAVDLFERSGLGATTDEPDGPDATTDESDGLDYEVEIPPYRVDVLHPADLVDDVGRAHGFNTLEPRYPDVSTVGGRHARSRLERAVRETLVGLGFEDLLNFHMISASENYDRMGLDPDADAFGGGAPVSIEGPYSDEYSMIRTWALPSLAMVLENNTHRSYPQALTEVGFTAERDPSASSGVGERRTVAGVLARTGVSYEDAKARLQALATAFDVELETPATEHPSFIDGRVATVRFDGVPAGVVGELHPAVLVEHDLEVPVAAFEFDLVTLA